jgi:hypothetical protein
MTRKMMARAIGMMVLITASACSSLRETRMEAAASYAPKHVYVVPTPTPLLAGPDTVRTYSPDGSTVFICADGSVRDATQDKNACL